MNALMCQKCGKYGKQKKVPFSASLLKVLVSVNIGVNGVGWFTYTEGPKYGPFLQSVNGLAGSYENRTYSELLVKKTNNQIIRPDVGIGCYIPSANEQIILNYNKY